MATQIRLECALFNYWRVWAASYWNCRYFFVWEAYVCNYGCFEWAWNCI